MRKLILILCALITACNSNNTNHASYDKKIAFITHQTYTPSDIGGSANVDSICQSQADLSLLTAGRTYIAFYATSAQTFADRANVFTAKWKGAGAADNSTFALDEKAPLGKDQYGNSVKDFKVWINTDLAGATDTGSDCADLTSISALENARYSNGNSNITESCDIANYRLLCIEN